MIKGQFTYEEAAAYIERIPKFTKKHPLWHTREFLHRLSDPAMDARIISVPERMEKVRYVHICRRS